MLGYLIIVLLIDLFAIGILTKDLFKRNDIRRKNPLVYALLFIGLLFLYFSAQLETGGDPLTVFLDSITAVRDIFVFKFNYRLIQPVFVDYPLMRIVYLLTIILTYYYVARLIIGIFLRKTHMKFVIHRIRRKQITVVIGGCEEGKSFLIENPNNTILWCEKGEIDKTPIFQKPLSVDGFKYLSKFKNVEFVIFADDETSARTANYFIESLDEKDYTDSNIFLTIVIAQKYSHVYETIVEKGRGLIKVVNKHEIMAKEVIKKYPLSKFLDTRFVESNGLVKEECTIQAIFVGYGNVNQNLYLNTVMNSQFATTLNGKLTTKTVKYHIIEKENKQYNKELNHTLFRIDSNEFNTSSYFPVPDAIHDTRYLQLNINDKEFYQTFDEIAQTPNSKTFVYISIDDDIENLDLVLKLQEHIDYYGLKDIVLFVRIRDFDSIKHLFAAEKALKDIIVYGSYKDYIIGDVLFDRKLDNASISAATQYEKSRDGAKSTYPIKPRHNWSAIGVYKQESNRYAVLNINFKLNLLGFSLYDESLPSVNSTSFYDVYDHDNERSNNARLNYDLKTPFKARDVMAFIEHSRWNAFHIANGYIPLPKHLLTLDSNKDMYLKLHGCLTTFEGLIDYQNHLIAQIKDDSLTPEEKIFKVDVIKYDYDTLDELPTNIEALGQILHKRQL